MANPEHVEIVKQGAEAIREWREKNPGVKLDLRGADFATANLSGANLRGAEVGGCLTAEEICVASILDASSSSSQASVGQSQPLPYGPRRFLPSCFSSDRSTASRVF
jgi:hypothetical protein